MESYRIKNDKSGAILLEVNEGDSVNAWEAAYEIIKQHPEYDVVIEVYADGKFTHWVDSESIVHDCKEKGDVLMG